VAACEAHGPHCKCAATPRAMYKEMARIKITPLWAKLLDFQTRVPTPIEKLIRGAS